MRRIGSRRKVESSRQSAGLRIERIEKLTGGRLGRLEVRGWRQSLPILPEEEGGIWGERKDESWGKEAKKKRSKRKEMKDKEEEEARKEERRNATMERG